MRGGSIPPFTSRSAGMRESLRQLLRLLALAALLFGAAGQAGLAMGADRAPPVPPALLPPELAAVRAPPSGPARGGDADAGDATRNPPPGAAARSSGTGFFVADDGTVMTAAHVVRECRAIHILSRHVPAVAARVVVTDQEHDIALLRADGVRVPAHLAVGPARREAPHVLVLGFPLGARHDVPDETWATVVNDHFVHTASLETDRHTLLWLQNRDIAQGYSGGPVVDPFSGRVVGIVRALIDPKRAARVYGIATPDLSIGPGATPLRALLAGTAAATQASPAGDVLDVARRATVHIVCWQ